MRAIFWNILGFLTLALAVLGAILPILPTTPFLLLSLACYYRGSKRMHRWLLTNRLFGRYLSDYKAGLGIPMGTKVGTLCLLWATILFSAVFFAQSWHLRAFLALVLVGVSTHILLLKTRRPDA